jgi:hypothetical protein
MWSNARVQQRAVKRVRCKALLCVASQTETATAHCLYVLIYQNRVSIWINNHKASWASRAFVCFRNHVYATRFELISSHQRHDRASLRRCRLPRLVRRASLVNLKLQPHSLPFRLASTWNRLA